MNNKDFDRCQVTPMMIKDEKRIDFSEDGMGY